MKSTLHVENPIISNTFYLQFFALVQFDVSQNKNNFI